MSSVTIYIYIYISTQLHSLPFNQQYMYVYLYVRILYITYRPCNTSTNSRNLERYILHTYCIAHTKLKLSGFYRGSELRANLAHGFRVKTKWTIIPTNGRSKWFLIFSTAVCSVVSYIFEITCQWWFIMYPTWHFRGPLGRHHFLPRPWWLRNGSHKPQGAVPRLSHCS